MNLDKEPNFSEPNWRENNDLIKTALAEQLQKMAERQKGIERTDSKYILLKDFLSKLKKQSFNEAFSSLKDYEKHAIITRLQNETKRFGGPFEVKHIDELEKETYGTVIYEGREKIDSKKSSELETMLQEKNSHLYK